MSAFFMAVAVIWLIRNVPFRFTSITLSKVSSDILSKYLSIVIPAELTTMSGGLEYFSRIFFIVSSTDDFLETSNFTAKCWAEFSSFSMT